LYLFYKNIAFSVAVNFAKSGIILELMSNNYTRFFDCQILSDYRNEDEKLFLVSTYTSPMSFLSIRHIEYKHNYKCFISALSVFQEMLSDEESTEIPV